MGLNTNIQFYSLPIPTRTTERLGGWGGRQAYKNRKIRRRNNSNWEADGQIATDLKPKFQAGFGEGENQPNLYCRILLKPRWQYQIPLEPGTNRVVNTDQVKAVCRAVRPPNLTSVPAAGWLPSPQKAGGPIATGVTGALDGAAHRALGCEYWTSWMLRSPFHSQATRVLRPEDSSMGTLTSPRGKT